MLNQKEKDQVLKVILLIVGGLMVLVGSLLFFLTPIPSERLLSTIGFHNYQWTGLEIVLLKLVSLFVAFWGAILVRIAKDPPKNTFLIYLTMGLFTLVLLSCFWALHIPQAVTQFGEQFFLTRIIVLSILVLLLIFLRPRKEKNIFKLMLKKIF